METILAALGAKPVEWNYKTECCGAGMTMANEETVLELSHKILDQRRRARRQLRRGGLPDVPRESGHEAGGHRAALRRRARACRSITCRTWSAWPWAWTSRRWASTAIRVRRSGRTNHVRIGVFICWCGENIARTVDVEKVAEAGRPSCPACAASVHYKYMCSDPGQALIREKIAAEKLDGVVVASCSPHMHLKTFRKAAAAAGLNPYLVEMANIREHCSWVHHDRDEATAKAIDLIRMAVAKVRRNHALEPIHVPVTKRALVIGGGVAGIQAALDIADAGYEVVLVEREPSIGGKMAGLSETFPTLDCSQCILTPRMVEVGQHPNIKLLHLLRSRGGRGLRRQLQGHDPQEGALRRHRQVHRLRRVLERLPARRRTRASSTTAWASGTAIYMPFPQAVPARPVIDKNACTKLTQGQVRPVREEVPGRRDQLRGRGPDRSTRRSARSSSPPATSSTSIGKEQDNAEAHRLRRVRLRQVQGRDRLAAVRAARLGLGPDRRRDQAARPTARSRRTSCSSAASARATTPRACRYCSKICCMYTAKHTMLYKHKVHDGAGARLLHGHPRGRQELRRVRAPRDRAGRRAATTAAACRRSPRRTAS